MNAAQGLTASVTQRAEEIVGMGGFSSVSGMEKVLTEQAQAISRSDSRYPNFCDLCHGFQRTANCEADVLSMLVAPVIEMSFATNLISGAFGHQIWNLLPQSCAFVFSALFSANSI